MFIGVALNTVTNWLESCGGCCTARKLCSDLSHILESLSRLAALLWGGGGTCGGSTVAFPTRFV